MQPKAFRYICSALLCIWASSADYPVAAAPPEQTKNIDLTFQHVRFSTVYVPSLKGGLPQAIALTAGSASRGDEMVGLEKAGIGDLNKDGLDDAAVIFWDNTGSDAYWKYLGLS